MTRESEQRDQLKEGESEKNERRESRESRTEVREDDAGRSRQGEREGKKVHGSAAHTHTANSDDRLTGDAGARRRGRGAASPPATVSGCAQTATGERQGGKLADTIRESRQASGGRRLSYLARASVGGESSVRRVQQRKER